MSDTNETARSRRRILKALGAGALALPFQTRAAEPYPTRAIRVVVPVPAGGIVDIVARAVTDRIRETMQQPLIVENRPGGSYVIAVNTAAAAPADGYTALVVHIGLVAAQASLRQFDLLDAFQPVGLMGMLPSAITVAADGPYPDLQSLVAFGRANPGKLSYATPGIGSIEHLKSVEFERAAGFSSIHVAYRGGPDMVTSLIRGDTQFSMLPVPLAEPYVARRQLRYVAMLDDQRMPEHPGLPTARELGIGIGAMNSWMGVMMRKDAPRAAVDFLAERLAGAMRSSTVADRLKPTYTRMVWSDRPADFQSRIESELTWMSPIANRLELKAG